MQHAVAAGASMIWIARASLSTEPRIQSPDGEGGLAGVLVDFAHG